MKSIIKYRNSVSLFTNRDPDQVKLELQALAKTGLSELKPSKLQQTGDTLFFTSGMFRFVGGWNLLNPISEGTIQVVREEKNICVRYEIQFVEAFLLTLFLSLIVGLQGQDTGMKLFVIAFIILWFYGIRVGISISRYKTFIKRLITTFEANEVPAIAEEQAPWIADFNTCDACGHPVTHSDKDCPDCGIRLR